MLRFFRHEYACARLRAMKGRMLKDDMFSKLVVSKSFPELAGLLEKTGYEKVFYNAMEKGSVSIENLLDRFFVDMLKKIRGFYPEKDRTMLDFFIKEWEIRDLSIIVKSIDGGYDTSRFLLGTIDANLTETKIS